MDVSSHLGASRKSISNSSGGVSIPALNADDGSEIFLNNLKKLAENLVLSTSPFKREEVLNGLAERLQTQKRASYLLEEILKKSNEKSSQHNFKLDELLDALSVPELQIGSPALRAFHREYVSVPFRLQVDLIAPHLTLAQGCSGEGDESLFDAMFGQADRLKLEFGIIRAEVSVAYPHALKGLLDKFLPYDNLGAPSKDDVLSARQAGFLMIEPFCAVSTFQEKIEVIAALLHAERQAAALPVSMSEQERFGFKLGYFLEVLGAGTQKICQCGHSLSITPKEWLTGLAPSKTDGGHIPRWEVWHRIDALPDEVQKNIVQLGKRKGTGSYQTTYQIKLKAEFAERIIHDHPESYPRTTPLVLKLLKDGARERAIGSITLVRSIFSEIAKEGPEARSSVEPLMKLLRHALRMVERETDLRNAKIQERNAFNSYKRIRVSVNESEYTLRPTPIFAEGEIFQIAKEVQGVHFNHLVAQNDPRAREYAAAILVVLGITLFSGRASNHDPHGDNLGVDGENIEDFDLGGVELAPPSSNAKDLLVQVLFNAAINGKKNRFSFLSSLKHTMNKMEEAGLRGRHLGEEDFSFIDSTGRTLVSWSDYQKKLLQVRGKGGFSDLKTIGKAVIGSGEMDPIIGSALFKRLFLLKYLPFSERYPRINKLIEGLPPFCGLGWLTEGLADERFNRGKFYPNNPNPHLQQKVVQRKDENSSLNSSVLPLRIKVTVSRPRASLKSIGFKVLSKFI